MSAEPEAVPRKTWLPTIDTPAYHLMLGTIAILVLGPLGGVTATYMNFSLGFFVGGQVLAGILGSTITYGYGADGRHGANYMQTMAASVAGMAAMGVLVQAMRWLGLPEPPAWQLVLYFLCIGMFGVGLGMLYTPLLVDRMNLMYPSGLAVANILRALTDKRLLQRSIAKLGGGIALGYTGGLSAAKIAAIEATGLSTSTLGAGMIVGARIGISGLIAALLGVALRPYLVSIGWLAEGAPFRKIGFILALGMILGAAAVDISLLFYRLARGRVGAGDDAHDEVPARVEAWQQTNLLRLTIWVVFWGAATVAMAIGVMHVQPLFAFMAVGLVLVFLLINGISTGVSDSNPISSAFVVSVLIMAAAGLTDAGVGLLAGGVLLIATGVGVDMQQDRSTGKRLGTNRNVQFRYQVIGVVMGAIVAVALAKVFMAAYPVLERNQHLMSEAERAAPDVRRWTSAMTYKFVGALQDITHPKPHTMKALWLGIAIGLTTEIVRKVVKSLDAWKRWVTSSRAGFAADFLFDAVLVPSPYASSFGGFVDWEVTAWFAGGGVFSSAYNTYEDHHKAPQEHGATALPDDMSTTSLLGGGLIAGESLSALTLGILGLLSTLAR